MWVRGERPRVLDLFCGAGGASWGYHLAGFDVYGVDLDPQPDYPFPMKVMSAMDIKRGQVLGKFDLVHASPPCPAYSAARAGAETKHPRLVGPTRRMLESWGVPWIIENVPGAPLNMGRWEDGGGFMLCGSMFRKLWVRRHRLFEYGGWVGPSQMFCQHTNQKLKSPGFVQIKGGSARERANEMHELLELPGVPEDNHYMVSPTLSINGFNGRGGGYDLEDWKEVMGMPWATTKKGVKNAIPPAYTKFIGRRFVRSITEAAA